MTASNSSSGLRVADGVQVDHTQGHRPRSRRVPEADGELLQGQPLRPVSLGFEAYRKLARAS
jgi:hypothetical protein